MSPLALVGLLIGLTLGTLVGFLLAGSRHQHRVLELERSLMQERAGGQARIAALEESRDRTLAEFARLSQEALQANNAQFLDLATAKLNESRQAATGDLDQRQQAIAALVDPLGKMLENYQRGLRDLETNRVGAYRGLEEQMRGIATTHEQLQRETKQLASALRSPNARGRWGEMQLRKVVELAGMVEHCDFDTQVTSASEDGHNRPDLVAHLPGHKHLAVDSKVPLEAFLRAQDAETDEVRAAAYKEHARHLRNHVEALSKKEYWKSLEVSPEFVVAFIPGEPLLAAAFDADPTLMEFAISRRVLLATPTTLISLLWAVAFGWQQDALADNAREIQDLGTELYGRLSKLGDYLRKLGKGLSVAVESYNEAVGSIEQRVFVTARKFPELGVNTGGDTELAVLQPLASVPRNLQAPELSPLNDNVVAIGSNESLSHPEVV